MAIRRCLTRGKPAVAIALAAWFVASWFLGVVLGSFGLLLLGCYLGASLLRVRWRVVLAAGALVFAMLPWLGLGHGSFGYPTGERLLPTLPISTDTRDRLMPLYDWAEIPLRELSWDLPWEFDELINFGGEGVVTVMPFMVFFFWASIAAVFGLSAVAGAIAQRSVGGPNPADLARRHRILLFIRTACLSAFGVFVIAFALSVAFRGFFVTPWNRDNQFGYFAHDLLIPLSILTGFVVPCARRDGLPKIITPAVVGGFGGLVVAAKCLASLGEASIWRYSDCLGLAMPMGVAVGATTVACVYALCHWIVGARAKRFVGRHAV